MNLYVFTPIIYTIKFVNKTHSLIGGEALCAFPLIFLKGAIIMKLTQIKQAIYHVGFLIDKHSPVILTGIAVATGVTAVVLATKTTIKATRIVDAENAKRTDEGQEKLTTIEVVKEVGVDYIPVGLTAVASATCMIASTAILSKRNAALLSMCALATTQLKEYEDKIESMFGKKKAQEARVAIEEDKIKSNPDTYKNVLVTGKGDTLCRDCLSGQMFRSSVEKIHGAIQAANDELLNGGYISLNDVYYFMGLEQTQIGDEQGWHIENGLIMEDYDSALSKDNEPILLVRFRNLPRYRFDR